MRRRVAALVIILAVVALVVWALTAFARGGSNETEETTPTSVPETLVTTPTEPDPGESERHTVTSPAESPTAEPSESAAPDEAALAAKKTCELQDLQLTVTTDKTAYDAEDPKDQPKLQVDVRNPTGADCEIDMNDEKLRFEVYSIGREGFQPVWGDTDCYDPVITGQQTFAAGETRQFGATWSRLGSAPGQCSGRQEVPPGAYVVAVKMGENTSGQETFNIN